MTDAQATSRAVKMYTAKAQKSWSAIGKKNDQEDWGAPGTKQFQMGSFVQSLCQLGNNEVTEVVAEMEANGRHVLPWAGAGKAGAAGREAGVGQEVARLKQDAGRSPCKAPWWP
jgi:hypothetical protein